MKKIIFALIIITLLSGCPDPKEAANQDDGRIPKEKIDSEAWDRFYGIIFSQHILLHEDFGDTLSNDYSIAENVYLAYEIMDQHITYQLPDEDEDDVVLNPITYWERGYGDCKAYSILMLNILYIELGIEASIALVWNGGSTSSREISNGGDCNHAIIMIEDVLYEPQNGEVVHYDTIEYVYGFKEVYSREPGLLSQ